jgi:membrane fusion protein, heavy metal efflux system
MIEMSELSAAPSAAVPVSSAVPGSQSSAAAAPSFPILRAVRQWAIRAVGGSIAVGALVVGLVLYFQEEKKAGGAQAGSGANEAEKKAGVEIVSAETIRVTPEVVWSLGIQTAEVKAADHSRALPSLQGVLNIDHNRMVRSRPPFGGLVVALGTTSKGETDKPCGESGPRGLRNGDRVEAGQLLAVVWSKDLGEKKSELVQAVSDLRLAKDQLERYRSLTEGIIAQKEVRVAEANLRAAENSVAKAEATLRAWRLPEAEIAALIKEAEQLGTAEARRELTSGRTWARVEVRAPFSGVILEKNTNIGDLVDPTTVLFLIADLSRLIVYAQAYEDDLPAIQALTQPVHWEIRLPARPEFRGSGILEQIGDIIDPAQHTAVVSGTVDNPRGELKAGQFVTATVQVPPTGKELEVPTAAIIEDGKTSVVFVQASPGAMTYTRRSVSVSRRYHDVSFVRSDVERSIRAGDRIIAGGALQLNQFLVDAPSLGRQAPPASTPPNLTSSR